MTHYTLVKVFDLSTAPADLQAAPESQMLRASPEGDTDGAMVAIWVGSRASTLEPPTGSTDTPKVTAWEHCVHKWLSKSGANAGDMVLLTWGPLGSATNTRQTAPESPPPPRSGRLDSAAQRGQSRAVH